MRRVVEGGWRAFAAGGWAPAAVLALHVVIDQGFGLYEAWPRVDVPMHFLGGLAIAYVVSRGFQDLSRGARAGAVRAAALELVLVGSVTTTVAVLWEFAEFGLDLVAGSNVQFGLVNTMRDLAMGMLGAAAVMAARAWRLRSRVGEAGAVALAWLRGDSA